MKYKILKIISLQNIFKRRISSNNDGHKNNKPVESRTKFKINQHDPILTKEQSIGSKISKSICERKNNRAAFCFKRKTFFIFQDII